MVKSSKDVVAAWAEETATYIIRNLDEESSALVPQDVSLMEFLNGMLQGHASTCYSYWPYVQLEYESVHQKLLQETWLRYQCHVITKFCGLVHTSHAQANKNG